MKKLQHALLTLFIIAPCAHAQVPPKPIEAMVKADVTRDPITKYMYGQFVEHLGGIINSGIWAEMIDDRKFYFPVISPSKIPVTRRAGGRAMLRRWNPIGPADSIVMDSANPFVGNHSPWIKLDPTTVHGISQQGLTIRKDKSYVGHVVLSGDPGVKVSINLVWGAGDGDRQVVTAGNLTAAYSSIPINITAGADSEDARIEIVGTGAGSFHVGAISLMPADNKQGFRAEVVDALALLHSGVYRFPGGNYISGYDWRDSIGDRDKRPPRLDPAWNAVQSNDVGLDEFMTLFGLIGVEPYMSVNAGFGDAASAADLVEYANGSAATPMGQRRAANGHPPPYAIKLWGIGNEMYGEWQLGVMPLVQYEIKHNLFARAMRQVDPTITLIASGAAPDEMTVTLQGKRLDGNVLTQFGSPADWTGGMLSKCLDNIDMVSEHAYCTNGQRFDLDRGNYINVDTDDSLFDWAHRPANRVRAKFEDYQEYAQRIPGLRNKPVFVALDEYSYRQIRNTSFKAALAYACHFNELFRHTELYHLTAFTFATSCLSSNRTETVLSPVGLVFKLYRDHFGTVPVEVTGKSPVPPPKYPIGGDQPKVNAGGDTYPLDVVAAFGGDRKTMTVAVINATESAQTLNLSFEGITLRGKAHLWRMAPADVNATIMIGQKAGVSIDDVPLETAPQNPSIPAGSVSIYEFGIGG